MSFDRSIVSPYGQYRADFYDDEWRMGHWDSVPTITDLASEKVIFVMADKVDAEVKWHGGGRIEIPFSFAQYRHNALLWLDPPQDRAWMDGAESDAVPMAKARAMIDMHIRAMTGATPVIAAPVIATADKAAPAPASEPASAATSGSASLAKYMLIVAGLGLGVAAIIW